MRIKILTSVLVLSSVLLSACETLTSSDRVIVSSAEKWAVLPIKNLSRTPLAGSRASALVETHLHSRGVKNVEVYEAPADQSILALLDDASQLENAKAWARQNDFRYGVTGDVQEWAYKNGLDNEPSVGMTLKFIDLHSNEVMWVANASRTGWGYSNLSSTASKTIDELFTQVAFRENTRGRPTLAAAKPPAPTALPTLPSNGQGAPQVTAPIRPPYIDNQ